MSKLTKEELLELFDEVFNIAISSASSVFAKELRQAFSQIREMIQKPEVTEEWIEEKAKELLSKSFYLGIYKDINKAKDFIRSLVEEIK